MENQIELTETKKQALRTLEMSDFYKFKLLSPAEIKFNNRVDKAAYFHVLNNHKTGVESFYFWYDAQFTDETFLFNIHHLIKDTFEKDADILESACMNSEDSGHDNIMCFLNDTIWNGIDYVWLSKELFRQYKLFIETAVN